MASDSDSYHSESEFYYPDEENIPSANTNYGNARNDNEEDEMLTIQEYIEKQRPENTTKKTGYDINVWNRYWLSIDMEFAKSREVLLAKRRELVEKHAKGNRPQAARAITESEEDLLFRTKQFGDHDPEVLQRTVWWVLSLHFGFRARDESRKLRWGDIVIEKDPERDEEVLVWAAERGSKTRHGEGTHQRAFNPTARPTNNERCPVKLYKMFAAHRSEKMKHPDSPFFLAINHKRKPDSQIWYCNSPLGKNAIGKFLVNAAKAAGLSGKISNHSVRKTCISRLMDADLPENYVAQLSGHKNLKSLDSYKAASEGHQRRMSMVLSRSSASYSGNSEMKTEKMCQSVQQEASSSKTEGFFLRSHDWQVRRMYLQFYVLCSAGEFRRQHLVALKKEETRRDHKR
ncbi:hypothetical protein ACROYT_G037299 [Oculina patagonica]